MDTSDIYSSQEKPNNGRKPLRAVSQRRDEYLRATGGESVHRHHHQEHHHHEQPNPASGSKIVLPGLGVLLLLVAGALWWVLSR
jgi:hypothetical protein